MERGAKGIIVQVRYIGKTSEEVQERGSEMGGGPVMSEVKQKRRKG